MKQTVHKRKRKRVRAEPITAIDVVAILFMIMLLVGMLKAGF